MPKKMAAWRLDVELLDRLKDEAEALGIDVTQLVEEKLETPHPLVEILEVMRRIERKLQN